jgi:hypothetical protein
MFFMANLWIEWSQVQQFSASVAIRLSTPAVPRSAVLCVPGCTAHRPGSSLAFRLVVRPKPCEEIERKRGQTTGERVFQGAVAWRRFAIASSLGNEDVMVADNDA